MCGWEWAVLAKYGGMGTRDTNLLVAGFFLLSALNPNHFSSSLGEILLDQCNKNTYTDLQTEYQKTKPSNTTKRHTNAFGNLLYDTRGKYHFQVCPQQFSNRVGHLSSRQSLMTKCFFLERIGWKIRFMYSVLFILKFSVQFYGLLMTSE